MHTIILILGTNIMVGNDSHKCILIEVVVVGCDPTAVASAEAVYHLVHTQAKSHGRSLFSLVLLA